MATNRADTLDPALLRPGRLDRKIEFPLPDRRQKRLIFSTITGKMNLSDEVDLEDCIFCINVYNNTDLLVSSNQLKIHFRSSFFEVTKTLLLVEKSRCSNSLHSFIFCFAKFSNVVINYVSRHRMAGYSEKPSKIFLYCLQRCEKTIRVLANFQTAT